MNVLNIIFNIAILIMFVIMFVIVIKIRSLQKEILDSGGYPSVSYTRAIRDAAYILAGRSPWDYKKDEIIEILSRYPDDPEATELARRLTARDDDSNGPNTGNPD